MSSIPEIYTRRQLNYLYREIPLKDTTFRLLRKYFSAASNLYGIIPLRKIYEIIDNQNPGLISKDHFISFAKIARHEREGYFILSDDEIFNSGKYTPFLDYEIIDTTLIEIDIIRYIILKKAQYNKPYYIPAKNSMLAYADPFYSDATTEVGALQCFLKETLHLESQLEHVIYGIIFFGSRCLNVSFDTILKKVEENGVVFENNAQIEQLKKLYIDFTDKTRMQTNRGHTPLEILSQKKTNTADSRKPSKTEFCFHQSKSSSPMFIQQIIQPDSQFTSDSISLATTNNKKQEKPGRNHRCPCGSGRKYKHCCGR